MSRFGGRTRFLGYQPLAHVKTDHMKYENLDEALSPIASCGRAALAAIRKERPSWSSQSKAGLAE